MSSGEPAGIGPDICIALAQETLPVRLAVLGDPELLSARARLLGVAIGFDTVDRAEDIRPHAAGTMQVLPIAADASVVPGAPDPANARYVLRMLDAGAAMCLRGELHALVTAPVQKSVINDAGIAFTGHTEYLAALTGSALPVMMLAGGGCRVALATTHVPLRAVPGALGVDRLTQILSIVHGDLRLKFGIPAPRILVLGLNPHAGEGGHLGDEERLVIAPAVESLRAQGMALTGPVAADTAFTPDSLARCDAVLAMYHDQGLAPLKALGFGDVVNVTLGLPIVRTSVDHGTALDLAGSGRARHSSLRAAVELARQLAALSAG